MKNILLKIWNYNEEIFKGILIFLSIILLVSVFPRQASFKYEFEKSKPWMHSDLIAPFNFAIQKPANELQKEEAELVKDVAEFYRYDEQATTKGKQKLRTEFESTWNKVKDTLRSQDKQKSFSICNRIVDTLYYHGIVQLSENAMPTAEILIVKNGVAEKRGISKLFTIQSADAYIRAKLSVIPNINIGLLQTIIINSIDYNVFFDNQTTQGEKKNALANMSYTRGMVQMGEKIISEGELISPEKELVLSSFQKEYEAQVGSRSKQNYIMIGQAILVCISLLVLILFLAFYRKDIFRNNKKMILIMLIIYMMVFISSMVVKYDVNLLYWVPLCIVPIIIRSFFDTRLALFVHLVTIILAGFLVPNRFEFAFMQLIAGIIAIISMAKLQNRSQFFTTSLYVFLTYGIIYTGLVLTQEGSMEHLHLFDYVKFGGSAVLTLLSYPLLFILEKIFGFVTDVSLMELADTNNKLLRDLSRKAPGTFQHSLHVGNMSEEIINQIGGDALLVRTAALYHDIGKMDMPMYFVENQMGSINPHDDLDYEESARIIVSHVIKGIEKAKKHNLPEEVIDFIRTHHGTTRVDYFYTLHKKENPDKVIDESIFTYHGPIPFSKETAVLMLADSVEAAARSLKEPTEEKINDLVDNIINHKIEIDQLINANITFKDITRIKKILKKQLATFYHLRVEYPK